ncbi:hypothetical protein QE152_g26774 [Popillia japonica]|uniref:Uncharacterized protein n=1 Tax=Popillia japonica TaxID=7064 RepID=A0AAW1JX77_POPJA
MCAKHVKYNYEQLYEILMNSDEENEDFDSEIGPEHSDDSSSSSNGSDIEKKVDQQYRKNKRLKFDDYCYSYILQIIISIRMTNFLKYE